MANLFSSMVSVAGALNAFDRALAVTQNNVANASTPGYVRQEQTLEALPFDPANGMGGGVTAGEVQSARDQYADRAVRSANTLAGQAQQDVSSLTALQSVFDVSGNSGISKALSNLFSSFSAWAQSPDDATARQTVLSSAANLAQSFQQTASQLAGLAQDAEQQTGQTVDTVNQLVGQLRNFNSRVMAGDTNDAGLDAEIHSTLQQLSQYISFTTLQQSNGTVNVLMNGQTALLVGDQQYQLSASQTQPSTPPPTYPNARPPVEILASDGTDITSATTGGQLGSLLKFHNTVLASYLGNAYQQGDLNTMAQQLADRVNQLLTAGNISDGPPAQSGVALFSYNSSDPANVAASLKVATGITADQLAAIAPGPPEVSNGTALALSALASPQKAADEIGGVSYSEYYGNLAARAGSALSDAKDQLSVEQSALAQAQSLQQQTSGVSLDEEAIQLTQLQRAYEANAKLLTVLDQLTQDTVNILPAA
jgi:flagellar hook-associated protein 1 FlgK